MKGVIKKKSNKEEISFFKIFVISITFGLLMIALMLIYLKSYRLIPIGWIRLLAYDITMLIPVLIVTLIDLIFKMPGASISDSLFYVMSFIIYFLLGLILLLKYQKIKHKKRKKSLLIFFSVLIVLLLICIRLEMWRFYGT
jgi:hypothetical protein